MPRDNTKLRRGCRVMVDQKMQRNIDKRDLAAAAGAARLPILLLISDNLIQD